MMHQVESGSWKEGYNGNSTLNAVFKNILQCRYSKYFKVAQQGEVKKSKQGQGLSPMVQSSPRIFPSQVLVSQHKLDLPEQSVMIFTGI